MILFLEFSFISLYRVEVDFLRDGSNLLSSKIALESANRVTEAKLLVFAL